jgi:hypothetical protein
MGQQGRIPIISRLRERARVGEIARQRPSRSVNHICPLLQVTQTDVVDQNHRETGTFIVKDWTARVTEVKPFAMCNTTDHGFVTWKSETRTPSQQVVQGVASKLDCPIVLPMVHNGQRHGFFSARMFAQWLQAILFPLKEDAGC